MMKALLSILLTLFFSMSGFAIEKASAKKVVIKIGSKAFSEKKSDKKSEKKIAKSFEEQLYSPDENTLDDTLSDGEEVDFEKLIETL